MNVTLTKFRREIFELVGRSLDGEHITIVYKGSRLRIVPEVPAGDRLSRLTSLQVVNPQSDDRDVIALKAEMASAWERDWSSL